MEKGYTGSLNIKNKFVIWTNNFFIFFFPIFIIQNKRFNKNSSFWVDSANSDRFLRFRVKGRLSDSDSDSDFQNHVCNYEAQVDAPLMEDKQAHELSRLNFLQNSIRLELENLWHYWSLFFVFSFFVLFFGFFVVFLFFFQSRKSPKSLFPSPWLFWVKCRCKLLLINCRLFGIGLGHKVRCLVG